MKERTLVTTLLELVGFVLIATGAFLVFPPAGFVVAGVLLVLVGYLADRGNA